MRSRSLAAGIDANTGSLAFPRTLALTGQRAGTGPAPTLAARGLLGANPQTSRSNPAASHWRS